MNLTAKADDYENALLSYNDAMTQHWSMLEVAYTSDASEVMEALLQANYDNIYNTDGSPKAPEIAYPYSCQFCYDQYVNNLGYAEALRMQADAAIVAGDAVMAYGNGLEYISPGSGSTYYQNAGSYYAAASCTYIMAAYFYTATDTYQPLCNYYALYGTGAQIPMPTP